MNLNGKVTNPGELNTQISLQTRTVSQDAGGFTTKAWATLATVWAKWENDHGQEAWTNASQGVIDRARVTIRYRTGVNARLAVLKGSTRYEIVSVDNVRERSEYIEMNVKFMEAA